MAVRTVTTLTGDSFVLLDPVALAELLRSPSGPVMREMIIIGEKVKQEAIRIAPRRTGNLANHIVKRIATTGVDPVVLVGVENVPYAIWVHEGSKDHPIDAKNAPFLVFRGRDGNLVFTKHVDHPGNKPNRFLVRALRVAVV